MSDVEQERPVLVILGGLPGSGKTTLARVLARRTSAVLLRIDSIEHAIRADGPLPDGEAGYRVGYALARDNLALGRHVIADSVNPIGITRRAWHGTATSVGATAFEIEVVCADPREHERRVRDRTADIDGFVLPTWEAVEQRTWEPWDADLRIDTARSAIEEAVERVVAALRERHSDAFS